MRWIMVHGPGSKPVDGDWQVVRSEDAGPKKATNKWASKINQLEQVGSANLNQRVTVKKKSGFRSWFPFLFKQKVETPVTAQSFDKVGAFKKADKLYNKLMSELKRPGTKEVFNEYGVYITHYEVLGTGANALSKDQFDDLKFFLEDLQKREGSIDTMSDDDVEVLNELCEFRLVYVDSLTKTPEPTNQAPVETGSPRPLKPMGDPYKETKAALSEVNLAERKEKFEAWRETINDPLYREADFYKLIPKTSGGGDSPLIVVAKRAHLEEGDNPSERLHALKRTLMANMTNNKEEHFPAAFELYLTYSPDGPEVLKLLQNDKVLEDPGLRSMADVATNPRVMVEAQSAMLKIQHAKRDAEVTEKAMTPGKLEDKVMEWQNRKTILDNMWFHLPEEADESARLKLAIPLAKKVIALLERPQGLKARYDQYLKSEMEEKATDIDLIDVLNALDLLGTLDSPNEDTTKQLGVSTGLIRNIYSSSGLPSID